MSSSIRLAMFDLDGTLLNTLPAIAEAGNYARQKLGLSTFEHEEWKAYIGHGLPWLIEQSLGDQREELYDDMHRHYTHHYDAHGDDLTSIYAGVEAMLDALIERGVALTVLTNKPHNAAVHVMKSKFPRHEFAAIIGNREGHPRKPDPTVGLQIAGDHDAEPEQVMYVGDSDVDMQTGRSAGFLTVGVTWGFRSREVLLNHGAQALVDEPNQLLNYLDGQPGSVECGKA